MTDEMPYAQAYNYMYVVHKIWLTKFTVSISFILDTFLLHELTIIIDIKDFIIHIISSEIRSKHVT